MSLKDLQIKWDQFGKSDPLWAILTDGEKIDGKWDINEFFETGVTEIAGVLSYLRNSEICLATGQALDFGCGVGRLTQAMAPHFTEVHGIDIAPSMIDLANQYNRYPEKCHYWLNASDNLKMFDDNSFDFVYTKIVLQHIKPKYTKRYLAEFMRTLRPGGVLLFQIPCRQNTTKRRRSVIETVKGALKKASPKAVLRLYRKVSRRPEWERQRTDKPVMDMYCIDQKTVCRVIHKNGGRVMDMVHNLAAGPDFDSVRYYATKK